MGVICYAAVITRTRKRGGESRVEGTRGEGREEVSATAACRTLKKEETKMKRRKIRIVGKGKRERKTDETLMESNLLFLMSFSHFLQALEARDNLFSSLLFHSWSS